MAAATVDRTPCNDEACAFDIVWAILIPGALAILAFGIALVASIMYFSGRRPEAAAAIFFFFAVAAFEHWIFL